MNIILIIIILAAVGGLVYYFKFYRDDTYIPYPVPKPDQWIIAYSKNMAGQLDGQGSVDLPVGQDGFHYCYKLAPRLAVSQTITIKFNISGSGEFRQSKVGDTTAPALRLYFQRKGDDMNATKGTTEFYRWWSNPLCVQLKAGDSELSCVLAPDQWSSVYESGSAAPNQFADAVANVENIGFTCGGNGFGHGVYCTAPMKFTLNSFTVS